MIQRLLGMAAAISALTMATFGAAFGCSVVELAKKVHEPLQAYRKKEVEARKWHSAEGGAWHTYVTRNGRLHSIVRIDYGETGRSQTRASFLDAKDFGIEVVTERYAEPIGSGRPTRVVSRSSVVYFFCEADGVIYLPVNASADDSVGELHEAKSLKSLFFDAGELAPYLKRLN